MEVLSNEGGREGRMQEPEDKQDILLACYEPNI